MQPMDYAAGKHKGFAFVEYNDAEDANEAIYNLDGSELYGRVLTVNLAQRDRLNIHSNKAVWSTDEFFQASSQQDNVDYTSQDNNNNNTMVEKVLREEGISQ
jgi:RNA-binding proteins (RRM domain)